MLENVNKENFRGDGDRHFLVFPSHPLLLQYLSAKQTAWLHLQRVIFCLCHINQQHNPTPPPNPCTNPHDTAPPCFCLSAKHGDSSSDGRKKFLPTCIKCKCVCWRRGAHTHTSRRKRSHTQTHNTTRAACLWEGRVTNNTKNTNVRRCKSKHFVHFKSVPAGLARLSHNKHMSDHIP